MTYGASDGGADSRPRRCRPKLEAPPEGAVRCDPSNLAPAATPVPQPGSGIFLVNQSGETVRVTVCVSQDTTKGEFMFKRRLLTRSRRLPLSRACSELARQGAGTPRLHHRSHAGAPGRSVNGQVNVADVAASCVTDLAEFQARFNDLTNNVLAFSAPDPLWLRFFPADVTDILTTIETHDQLAYTLTLLVALGIAGNQGGAAEAALPQTFVMTFADLATQEPVGELGHFDPVTGVGSVVVARCRTRSVGRRRGLCRAQLRSRRSRGGHPVEWQLSRRNRCACGQSDLPGVRGVGAGLPRQHEHRLRSHHRVRDRGRTDPHPEHRRHLMRWACSSSPCSTSRRRRPIARRTAGRTSPAWHSRIRVNASSS